MRRHRQDRDRPVEQPNRCRTPTHEQEEEEESSSAAASLLADAVLQHVVLGTTLLMN